MFENRRLRLATTAALFGTSACGSLGTRDKGLELRALPPSVPAVKQQPLSLEPPGSESWRKEVIAKISLHPELLRIAGREAQADPAIVKEAVAGNGLTLKWADKSLAANSEIALTACTQKAAAFPHVDEMLRLRSDFIYSALRRNGKVFLELPPPFRLERRYALGALRSDAGIFSKLAKELREDESFLQAAVIENPDILGEIPEPSRTGKLCQIALSIRPAAVSFVPPMLMRSAEDGKLLASLSGALALKNIPYGTEAYREAVCALARESLEVLDEVNLAAKSDAVLARRLVEMNGEAIQFFNDKTKDNREIARAAVKSAHGAAYPYLSKRLIKDREIALLACSCQTNTYHHLPAALKEDPKIISAALDCDPLALADTPLRYRKNRALVLRLIKKNGFAILGADDSLFDDRELMKEAVETSPHLTLSLAPLASDLPLLKRAVEREPSLAWILPAELKNDLELARLTVKQMPRALGCFGAEANADPALVKAVLSSLPDFENPNIHDVRDPAAIDEKVRKIMQPEPSEEHYAHLNECARQEALAKARAEHHRALLDAYDCLRDVPLGTFKDKELALLAVRKTPDLAVKLARAGILETETAACAVSHQPRLARELPLQIQNQAPVLRALAPDGVLGMVALDPGISNDPSKILPVLGQNGLALLGAGPAVRSDRECVLRAVGENGSALEGASRDLKADKAVVLSAVAKWGGAITYASPVLRADQEVMELAVQSYGAALRYSPVVSDRTLAWTAFGTSAAGYANLDSNLKSDAELTLRALRLDPSVILDAADSLLEDPDFLLKSANTSLSARPYLRHRLGSLPKEVEERFQQVETALAELNIRRPFAFDASGEVIRGRFAAAPPEMKARLSALLGEAFFKGLSDDNRPLAVLAFPRFDYNHAFDARESGLDLVDQLTHHYQVCYFEVSGTTEFAQSVREATIAGKREAQLLFVAAHGTRRSVQMGWAHDRVAGGLSIDEGGELKDLGPAVAPGGLVVVFGCNTAKGGERAKANVARFFGDVWPQAYVQAPVDAVVAVIRLNRGGSLRGLQFSAVLNGEQLPSPVFTLPPRR